jgi:tetratricopeptide (TPR) repeat protein
VLASETVTHLARKVAGVTYRKRGQAQLKGFVEPVTIIQALPDSEETATREAGQGQEGASQETAEIATSQEPLPIGGFLGALPEGALVARDEEQRQVLAAINAVTGGTGRLVCLVGEPGIGKTRLAQEVALLTRNRGFLVATGSCYAPYQAVPYYPFLEALATAYQSAAPTVKAALPERWTDVTRLLPQYRLSLPSARDGGSSQDEQQRLFWAVTGFLRTLAESQPLALLLDDLHWADHSSLSLLQHLVRHTRAARILFLGTYRPMDVPRTHPLAAILLDLGREHLLERIALKRLSVEATGAFIAAYLGMGEAPAEAAATICARTEGNPFFTQELLRALVERGDLSWEAHHWQQAVKEMIVPENVRAAIDERLSRLAGATQDVLQEASVLGQAFRFHDLAAMGGRPEKEIEGALEEATTAGLLHETGQEGYSFHHVLIQQALYMGLPARRKRRLHHAVGEALERLPERVRERRAADLAWHFTEAHQAERALPFTIQAGDQAEAVYAHLEAERQYRTACNLARELGDQRREAEALEKLGLAVRFLVRYTQALEALEQALALYQALGDVEGQGRVLALIGHLHVDAETMEAGLARVQPFVTSLCTGGLSLSGQSALLTALSRLYFNIAVYSTSAKESEERALHSAALSAAEQAEALAEEAQDKRLLGQARARRGSALQFLEREEEGIQMLEDAIRLLEASGELEALGVALNNMSEFSHLRGKYDLALADNVRALALAERRGDQFWIAYLKKQRGTLFFELGQWEQARQDFGQVLTMLREEPVALLPVFTHLDPWRLALAQGQAEAAAEYFQRDLALAERSGNPHALFWATSALAERDLMEGRPQAARAHLDPFLDRSSLRADERAWALHLLGWASLELGDLERAGVLLAEARTLATAHLSRLAGVGVLHSQARLALRQGRWQAAEQALAEALALTQAMHTPYEKAKTLYLSGLLHLQQGETQPARERLETALAICATLGERLYARQIEQTLAKLNTQE